MRRLLAVLGLIIATVVAVVLVRVMSFTIDQGPLPESPVVDIGTDAAAARLAGAIRIPTITRTEPPRLEPATFAAFRAYLAESFPLAHTRLSTTTIAQHSLLFEWKGSDPSLEPALLMAHQDVVPIAPGTTDSWTHPPFSGAIADGYVWGRGALDVKSGLVGILEAVEALLAEGFAPKRTVYLAFGHDEEVGGWGAQAIAKHLAERNVELEYVLDEGGMISQGIVPDVADPIALVGVAEKGYVSLGLHTRTAGGHSSMPPAATAVGILSRAIATLEANPFPVAMAHSRVFLEHVGPRMPFLKRLVFANLWLLEPVVVRIMSAKHTTAATLRTTTAPTIFRAGDKDNVLPHEAAAVVNFRIIPGETPETVLARVREVIDDPRVEVAPHGDPGTAFGSPPSPTSDITADSYLALVRTIRQVAADERLIVAPYLVVGATDSRFFTGLTPNVYRFLFNRIGDEDIPRLHGTNERISVEDYGDTVRFYYLLIRNTAG